MSSRHLGCRRCTEFRRSSTGSVVLTATCCHDVGSAIRNARWRKFNIAVFLCLVVTGRRARTTSENSWSAKTERMMRAEASRHNSMNSYMLCKKNHGVETCVDDPESCATEENLGGRDGWRNNGNCKSKSRSKSQITSFSSRKRKCECDVFVIVTL